MKFIGIGDLCQIACWFEPPVRYDLVNSISFEKLYLIKNKQCK